MRKPSLPYTLLKFALQTYGKTPAELDSNERTVVQSQAEEECHLQTKILASVPGMKAAVPEKAVEDALAAVAGRYDTESDFEADLAENGMTRQSMADALEVELAVEAAVGIVASQAEVPGEAEVEEAFATYHGQAAQLRSARHILITINDQFPDNSRLAALARINKVRSLAMKSNASFEELAARFSECPSSIQGGGLGKVGRGKLYPALDESLFSMEAGEISEVLESPMGFHILLCEEIADSAVEDPQKVKDAIRRKLYQKAQKKTVRTWLASLQGPADC